MHSRKGEIHVTIEDRLLPEGATNRLEEIRPTYITIHETSEGLEKQPSYKDMEHYTQVIWDRAQNGSTVGWHYLVSDTQIIRFIEDCYRTDHTGSPEGNATSIGIERIVNVNVDFPVAIFVQAKLTASLMRKWGIPITNVVPHKYWSGKECPARILAGEYGGWEAFIQIVEDCLNKEDFFQV
jgi:N-acetylmuramoyl-L-alanine amidase